MLILDVKGNYFNQVKKYAKTFNLLDDLIVLSLNSKVFYNIPPLDERKKNAVLSDFLSRIGIGDATAAKKSESKNIFGLFRR